MYAHPSFIRGRPELLSQLRKSTSSARRRITIKATLDDSDASSEGSLVRSVSPSPTRNLTANCFRSIVQSAISSPVGPPPQYVNQAWLTYIKPSYQQRNSIPTVSILPSAKKDGGRLDLLALAIERESCFSS
jgi:hypothetical protein